jgi:hypothetical protein
MDNVAATFAMGVNDPTIHLRRCNNPRTSQAALSLSAMISQYFMESLPFSSPDEFPTPRNLSACVSGLNDRQAHLFCGEISLL